MLGELAQLEPGWPGPLLVDAGAHSREGAFEVLSCGASEVVVGLETLRAFADLAAIVREVGTVARGLQSRPRLGRPISIPPCTMPAAPRPIR